MKTTPLFLLKSSLWALFLVTSGSLLLSFFFETNPLLWLIIPSVIFEQLFENCCYSLSNNHLFNFLFAIAFWSVIGLLAGLLGKRILGLIAKLVNKNMAASK